MKINNIQIFIDNIPTIISYLTYGYIYLTIYYWISFKENSDFNNLLVKSVASSYILMNIYELVFAKLNILITGNTLKVVIYCAISGILGLVLGKLTSWRWFNFFLHCFHIGRTTNENIWDDVIQPGTWLEIYMKDGTSYYGQYRFSEPFKNQPIIVLTTYQWLDEKKKIKVDYSDNPESSIMINTKDFEKIEVAYSKTIEQEWEDIKNTSLIVKAYRKIKQHK